MARMNLTSGVSNSDLTQYTTAAAMAPAPAKALILVWVANTGPNAEPSVSGAGGIMFTTVATVQLLGGTNRRLTCLRAMSNAPFAGPLTISFNVAQMACAWAVDTYTDVNTSGMNGEGAVTSPPTTKNTAADTTHSVALPSALSQGSVVAGAIMTRYSRAITPIAGLAEIDEQSMAGDYGTLETADRGDGQSSAGWSWTGNSESASILLEIKPQPVAVPGPQPVPTTITDRDLVKRFEPIMVMDPQEAFVPSDAKRYVEHCALWRAEPPFDDKNSWGGTAGDPFDRKPEIAKGKIAAIQGEPGDNTVDLPAGAPGGGPRERFLELAGWIDRFRTSQPDVTAASGNFYADRAAVGRLYTPSDGGDQTLPNSRFWYHAEVFRTDKLRALLPTVPAHDLVKVLDILDNPVLLNYYFFFPMHDEPLAPPCANIFAQEFGGFGGEWQCMSILLEGGDTLVPTFIGVTGRPVAQIPPRTVARINDDDPAGRFFMRVCRYDEAESIAAPDHIMTVLFAAKGTHSLYLREGVVQTTYPANEGPINCGLSEGPLLPPPPDDDSDDVPDAAKFFAKLVVGTAIGGPWGLVAGYTAAMAEFDGGFKVLGGPDTLDPPPPDAIPARMNAIIIKPDLNLVDFGPDQRKWAVQETSDGGRLYDFMVDRDKQLWWPSYSGETGFRGRWGPRVEKDPFYRRAGMRFPAYWAMFFRALATGKDAKVF
jgi:hypothetical protein